MDVTIPGYTIIRQICKGGMATIYLATQHNLARQVALKVMSPQLASDPAFGERFLREARITASMNHHSIVSVHDVGHYRDCHYLSMEFLPNGDLKWHIKNGIDPNRGLRIVFDILDALVYVHSKNYIHRDIKPENILFREDQTAVLTDFGIARTVDSATVGMTSCGTIVGSPRYMSPEQAKAEKIDFRTDIYSLGAVLYETLTGQRLYAAESSIAAAIKHISDPIPELPPRFSLLQPVLEKMLAKNPEDRFQSATATMEALTPYVLTPWEQWTEAGLRTGLCSAQDIREASGVTPIPLLRECPTMLHREKDPAASALTLVATDSRQYQIQRPVQKWFANLPGQKLKIGAYSVLALFVGAIPIHASMTSSVVTLAPVVAPQPLQESADPLVAYAAPTGMPGPPVLAASQSPVTALLVQADDALKLYRLTLPERSSAYDYYLRVLALEPGNEIARAGLNDIVERYLKLFDIALRNEDMTKAQQHLDRAAMVVARNRLNPDYSRLIASSQGAIDRIRNLHVQKNLESWNRLLQEPDTISVENLTQAYENYMQMLKVFPDDNKVHTANDIYAAAFYRTGEQYFQRNELDTSRRLIAMGLAINPQDQKLQDLQQRLERHKNDEQQSRQALPSASRQSFFERLF